MELVCEGKTKVIYRTNRPGEVLIVTKDDLTGGDAAQRETIKGISAYKTLQTINVFELLRNNGVPLSYISKGGNDTSMLCHECDMLPLELVMRRFAWGSMLKREPGYAREDGTPHRYEQVKTEFFHKHAVVMPPNTAQPVQMDEGDARDQFLKDGKWADGVYTDPYIHPVGEKWQLHPAKIPFNADEPLMTIDAVVGEEERKLIEKEIMIPTFEILENAWAKVETEDGPVALADIKIEVGRRKTDGRIALADVIDNDSWRIWPGANPKRQLDKQCFRDGDALSTVEEKYKLVAELTGRFLPVGGGKCSC